MLFTSSPINNLSDLQAAIAQAIRAAQSDAIAADESEYSTAPGVICFAEPLRLALEAETLTDGSTVYNARVMREEQARRHDAARVNPAPLPLVEVLGKF